MHDDLDTAVDGLFRAFEGAPLDDRVDYCDHCVDPDQVEALRVTPLRQLKAEQIGPFMVNAVTTWGDVTYFKHFLPRLLELVARGVMEDWSYPSFLPSRLAQCWTGGTEEERNAIVRFLRAWWSATISRRDGPCRPQDVLEVIDGCELSARPYLDTWSKDTSDAAVRHMADFIKDWMLGTWGSVRLAVDVDNWLRNDASSVMLDRLSDTALVGELTEAADLLAFYRTEPMVERQ